MSEHKIGKQIFFVKQFQLVTYKRNHLDIMTYLSTYKIFNYLLYKNVYLVTRK